MAEWIRLFGSEQQQQVEQIQGNQELSALYSTEKVKEYAARFPSFNTDTGIKIK